MFPLLQSSEERWKRNAVEKNTVYQISCSEIFKAEYFFYHLKNKKKTLLLF